MIMPRIRKKTCPQQCQNPSCYEIRKKEEESFRYCREENCKKRSSFGLIWNKPLYCKEHKQEEMIDVKNKRCKEKGCVLRPNFGTEWGKPLYCKQHQKEGMFDVIHKRCKENRCVSLPNFGTEWNKPLYCKQHKKEGMIDVIHKRCKEKGCVLRPNFGTEWGKPLYCKQHQKEGMEDVINKRCQHDECETRPSYGIVWNKPLYCKKHKKEGMEDVINKRCKEKDCESLPSYGSDWGKPLYCKQHAKEGMKDVINKRCKEKDCESQPSYGSDWGKPIYCKKHAKEGMENVVHKRCSLCDLTISSNPKYKSLCLRCFIYTYPDQKVARNYKVKEQHVADYIKQTYTDHYITFDKITGGCSLRRPDILIDLGTHTIIIEVDENQHEDYETTCEIARINELFTDLADRPIVFIRFNPDGYTKNKKKHLSSFKYNQKYGVPIVRKETEWKGRLNKLDDTIANWLNAIPNEAVIIENLFYDEYI
jgi:hypothetical protein